MTTRSLDRLHKDVEAREIVEKARARDARYGDGSTMDLLCS